MEEGFNIVVDSCGDGVMCVKIRSKDVLSLIQSMIYLSNKTYGDKPKYVLMKPETSIQLDFQMSERTRFGSAWKKTDVGRKVDVLGCTPIVSQGLKNDLELGYDMPMAYRIYAREWRAKNNPPSQARGERNENEVEK